MAVAKKKTTAKQAAAKQTTTKKKAAAKQAPAKRSAAKQTAGKRAPATKTAAKQTTAKRAPAKKKAAATKTAAKQTAGKRAPAKKKAAAKQTAGKRAPAKKKAAAKQAPAKRSAAKQAAAKQTTAKKATAKQATAKAPATTKAAKKTTVKKTSGSTPRASINHGGAVVATKSAETPSVVDLPKPRFNKDGFGYTKDFDLTFIKQMHDALQAERVLLTGQAKRLEDEAHQLVEEAEMGDVQFDDEGGEGDTMVVERERDLALSAQAREAVGEIDDALRRILKGTYGYSVMSGRPIPRERLEAIPWSTVLVEEKVGGIGRR